MGIRLHRGELCRLLCAEAGIDNDVRGMYNLVDAGGTLHPTSPWRHLGIAKQDFFITVRSSLRVIVFDVVGDWPVLESLGVGSQFAFAAMTMANGLLLAGVAPAQIDFMQVTAGLSEYRGRVDVALLGEMRSFEVSG